MPNITVEIIDRCMKDLHLGKACGPDDLSVEHLLYAHPSLIIHLKLLFSAILSHGVVPDNFGAGTIVPLIKDKSGNLNDVSNYRPITLIPVISKLFECIILNLCQECFVVDELQLGFKKNHGCNDAIFAVKTTVNYFTERGSCVYAAALDLSKAFDRVNHFKLFSSLLNAGLPVGIISVICNWYSKMFAAVRWGNAFSDSFHVGSGVRQGGTLSPSLFNTFINLFIVNLKVADIGCHIDSVFLGCFLYADDLIILHGLQLLLDTCAAVSNSLFLKFNYAKSHCIVFGKCCSSVTPMCLNGINIEWVNTIEYLGTCIVGGKKLRFDIARVKRGFYAACNSINSHAKTFDEILQLSLHESYCLPLLTYASAALSLTTQQINELNVCWNTMYRLVFKFHRWESVRNFVNGLGRLNLEFILKLQRVKFYNHLRNISNHVLYKLLWIYFTDSCNSDSCLSSLFLLRHAAVAKVYKDFSNTCT
jgi:hypothetical protein